MKHESNITVLNQVGSPLDGKDPAKTFKAIKNLKDETKKNCPKMFKKKGGVSPRQCIVSQTNCYNSQIV